MLKNCSFVAVAVLLMVFAARADQLAYNSLDISRRAAAEIKPDSILVSYCSQCDNELVEVWQVQKAIVSVTNERRQYEVQVFGKRLFKSKKKFDKGKYSEPVEYRKLTARPKGGKWFLNGIDLAYVYVPQGDGSYRNLARVLGMDARIKVDKINLPPDVAEQLPQEIAETRAEITGDETDE